MRFSLHWNTVGVLGIGVMSAFLFSAGVAVGRVHLVQPSKTLLFLCGFAATVIVNAVLFTAFRLVRRAAQTAQNQTRAGGKSA